ncbi:ATP-binding protein [Xanthobacter agilis]|uniref:ATP-binding protein n=1 Tax=Xanthobacter agilis TaxID=47492 RepID=UPI003729D8E7
MSVGAWQVECPAGTFGAMAARGLAGVLRWTGGGMSLVGTLRAGLRTPARPAGARIGRGVTLRAQVLGTVLVINVVAAFLAGWVVVLNARAATRSEMAAAVEMAERMVREAAERIALDPQAGAGALPVHLRHLRHVRLSLADPAGQHRGPASEPPRRGAAEAPAWFARLVGVDGPVREVPITSGGATVARVVVAGVPDDEIAEVWNDVTDFASVAIGVNGAILLALFLALGRVRRELARLRTALGALEHDRLCPPLAPPRIRELAEVADGVNALARALEAARAENARLNARLVSLEEDERRRIASELHDELGPLMFGLKAGADSLARMAVQVPGPLRERVADRAGNLVDIVERMQGANRRLLRRLRPAALGHVPLADVLASLVADFRQHDPERVFRLELGALGAGYGAALEATLYRCVQEGVTNALRHGGARSVSVVVGEGGTGAGSKWLRLVLRDDGRGLPSHVVDGLGLAGMRERVRALGGQCGLTQAAGGGACLMVEIPLPGAAALAPREEETLK